MGASELTRERGREGVRVSERAGEREERQRNSVNVRQFAVVGKQ